MTYQEIKQEIELIKEMIKRLIVPHFDKNEPFRINNNEIEKNVQKWWHISEKYRFSKHGVMTLDKIFDIIGCLHEKRADESKNVKVYYEMLGIELQEAFDYWISRYEDWIAVYEERLSKNAFPRRDSTDRTGSYVLYTTVPYELMNDYVNKTKKDLSEFYEKYLNTETALNSEENEDLTVPRQVLAMHYILKYLGAGNMDATKKAEFITFITGKKNSKGLTYAKHIYDMVRNPLSTDTGNFREDDLIEIRKYFDRLKLKAISEMIHNEIHN